MAFAVIAIHVSIKPIADTDFPEIIEWFITLAVPFFFIVSGYFVESKLSNLLSTIDKRRFLKTRSFKLFKLFFYWLIIYLPIAIYAYHGNGRLLLNDILEYIKGIIIFGESPYAWPLWFIYSMAIVLLIFSKVLYKKYSIPIIAVVSFLLYSINDVVKLGYIPNFGNIISTINTLTYRTLGGGIYIFSGMVLYRYRFWFNNFFVIIVSLTIMIFYSALAYYLKYPLSALFGGIGVFLTALLIRLPNIDLFLALRKLSMWVYYTHMLVVFALITIAPHLGYELRLWSAYAFCSAVSLLIAIALNKLSHLNKFQWLNILIK